MGGRRRRGLRWIDGGRAFLWMSERDGWRHVYRVPRDGGDGNAGHAVRRRRSSTWSASTRPAAGCTVTASPENATQRYLYRARLDGTGAPERVTPADQPGTHAYVLSPGAELAFHTWSRFESPAGDRGRRPARPSHAARAHGSDGADRRRSRPLLQPAGRVLHAWTSAAASCSTAGCSSRRRSTRRRSIRSSFYVYGEPAGQTVPGSLGRADACCFTALLPMPATSS